MEIKLTGSWVFNSHVERYYAIYRYYSGMGWVIRESGWERLYAAPEVVKYYYSRYSKANFVEYTPKGIEFHFKDPDEYLFCCVLQEVTEDEWPAPSWAIACELPPDRLN